MVKENEIEVPVTGGAGEDINTNPTSTPELNGDQGENTDLPEGVTQNDDGTYVNSDGKPVNEKGEVITSKEDDTTTGNEGSEGGDDTTIEIDGNDYKLDENGNAVNENGEVFKTKEELDKLEESNGGDDKGESDVTIEDIQKASGIEVYGEDGKPLSYDLTVEGLAKREKDIKDLGIKEGTNQAIDNFFKSNPDLYKAYMYKSQKGSLEGFSNTPYYQSIELDTNNEEQLYNFVVDAEVKRGRTPERAKAYADFVKNNNELEDVGKESYDYLSDLEKNEFTKFEEDNKKARQQQIQKEIEFYGTYYDENGKEVVADVENSVYDKVVNKGQIGKFNIPQEGVSLKTKDGTQKLTRKQVFDYISKPVKGSYTQAMLDEQKNISDVDTVLMRYLSNLTGNDFSSLVEREVLKSKNKNIKRRLSTKPASNTSSSRKGDSAKGGEQIIVPVK